jgi:enterochelin esterase-like enzyme
MKRYMPFAWGLVVLLWAGAGQADVQDLTYPSHLLGQDLPIKIYTPPGYESDVARYPVVYNLHGGGGSPERQWDRTRATLRDAMENHRVRPMIYVYVNGLGNTEFVNTRDGKPIERSIVEELIPFVDKTYRTIAARSGRAIDGFSMGGFGCLSVAFRHPDQFCAVVSYGAALTITAQGHNYRDEAHFAEHDPWAVVRVNTTAIRQNVRVRMVCGDADGLYESNVKFKTLLDELQIPVDWCPVVGVAHSTQGLYERRGLESLRFLQESFASAARGDLMSVPVNHTPSVRSAADRAVAEKCTVGLIGQSLLHYPNKGKIKDNLFDYLVRWGNGVYDVEFATASGAGMHSKIPGAAELAQKRFDYFLMCEGTVYPLEPNGVARTLQHMGRYVQAARQAGSTPLMFMPYPHRTWFLDAKWGTEARDKNLTIPLDASLIPSALRLYQQIAHQLQIEYIPVMEAHLLAQQWLAGRNLEVYYADNVHMTPDGHFLNAAVTHAILMNLRPEQIQFRGDATGLKLKSESLAIARETIRRYREQRALPLGAGAERVILDVDFSHGSAGAGKVTGGEFVPLGWTPKDKADNIFWEIGSGIGVKKGRVILEMTNLNPSEQVKGLKSGKNQFFALNERVRYEDGGKLKEIGTMVRLRMGYYRQFKVEATTTGREKWDERQVLPLTGPFDPARTYVFEIAYDPSGFAIRIDGVACYQQPWSVDGFQSLQIGETYPGPCNAFPGPIYKRIRYLAEPEIQVGMATASTAPERKGPSVDLSHGPLKVSENRRFLVHADGTPFFYLGDTAWELFHRLDRQQAVEYLDLRARQKYTVIQAVALAELDGIGDPNPYGDLPLIDKDATRPAVTPGKDPGNAEQYDYWDHVEFIVEEANKRGIHIGFLPTWGRWATTERSRNDDVVKVSNAQAYGEFLGKRFGKNSIIWILGGDRPATKHEDVWRALARGIVIGIAGREDYAAALMTFHPGGGHTSATWFHNDAWLDFNMQQTGHGPVQRAPQCWIKIANDYALEPVKPVMDGEPLYEDHPIGFREAPKWGYSVDAHVRQRAYWDVFSGAFGHTYGDHSVWQMYSPGKRGVNGPLLFWYEAIHSPGAAQMQHLRNLIESRPFLSRVPDQSLVAEQYTEGEYIAATRGDGYAFLYSGHGRTIKVNLGKISGDKVKAWWYNPRNGSVTAIDTFDNTGVREFVAPSHAGFAADWVLVLDDVSKNFAPPGRKSLFGN